MQRLLLFGLLTLVLSSALPIPCRAQTPPAPPGAAPSFDAMLVRANTLFKEGNVAEAFAAVQAAAKLEPARYEAPALAALILHKLGRVDLAKEALREAQRLAPAEHQTQLAAIAALIEKPVTATTAASGATSPAVVDPATLTGAVRRRYDGLMLIIEDADNAKLAEERRKHLREFLDKSKSFAAEHPGLFSLWLLRAVAALELEQAGVAKDASYQLIQLGADNSDDPKVRRVLAMLDRKGWLATERPQDSTGQPLVIDDLGLEMRWIAPGTFTMGSPASEEGRDADEGPLTQVTLSQGFWLGKTEVTQAQWQAITGANPSSFKGGSLPVESVSWTEAIDFCRKLTEREQNAGRLPDGYAYTLPTEAQWEYSCRAGTSAAFAGEIDAMAWYVENSGVGKTYNKNTKSYDLDYTTGTTHPVARKQPNAWGLYDMHGNVWEWCADWYADKLPGGSVSDLVGASSGTYRVSRGGSWNFTAGICRSALRDGHGPGFRGGLLGFRLALSSVP